MALSRRAGLGVADLLLGAAVGLLLLAAVTGALAAASRLLARAGRRAEAADTAQLAMEAFAFDVRRAGWDPAAAGIEAVALARADRVVMQADLDGNGLIDTASSESVAYVCAAATKRLSRIVGTQSMPLADAAVACTLTYVDGDGTPLDPPPGGLDAAARTRIGGIGLDLRLQPPGSQPLVARSLLVALAGAP